MTLNIHKKLCADIVLSGGGNVSFQSVTKCVADTCKNFQVNVEFPGGITIDFLTMPHTISMPQMGGLVQRREIISVGLES